MEEKTHSVETLAVGALFGALVTSAFGLLIVGVTATNPEHIVINQDTIDTASTPAELYQIFTEQAAPVLDRYGQTIEVRVITADEDRSIIFEPSYYEPEVSREPSVRMIEPTVAPAPTGPQG